MTIGQRIKDRRKEIGMSADQLGECLGKNRSTIYRYENGDIENMSIDMLEPIAKALHTTPAFLMGWDQAEIDAVSEVQESANNYSDSNEAELKDMMLEISNIGFSHAEIKKLQAYAHALKEAENVPDEVHKALVELFAKMYKLNLTIEDVEEVYTYAQYISSKHK